MSERVMKVGFGQLPPTARGSVRPFKVDVLDQDLQELQTLLKHSRISPTTYENGLPDGRLGITKAWLDDAVRIWKTDFDWRKHEQHINSFPAYIASINDDDGEVYSVHFVGLFSQNSDAVPLLLLHGWPGDFLEFLPILDILRNRYTPSTLPYHLIVPSLPGYTFSSPPPLNRDFQLQDIARLLHALVIDSLGFPSYIVQGGDVGSKVARIIATSYRACKAIHINFCIMPEPAADQLDHSIPITPGEQAGLARTAAFSRLGSAYALLHATKPSTIGFALSSNPVALLDSREIPRMVRHPSALHRHHPRVRLAVLVHQLHLHIAVSVPPALHAGRGGRA